MVKSREGQGVDNKSAGMLKYWVDVVIQSIPWMCNLAWKQIRSKLGDRTYSSEVPQTTGRPSLCNCTEEKGIGMTVTAIWFSKKLTYCARKDI